MNTSSTTSLAKLRKAIEISEKIVALEQELREVMGGMDGVGAVASAVAPARRGRPPKVQQAQNTSSTVAPARSGKNAKKKRVVSPEARAKMAAAQKRRWAKAKR